MKNTDNTESNKAKHIKSGCSCPMDNLTKLSDGSIFCIDHHKLWTCKESDVKIMDVDNPMCDFLKKFQDDPNFRDLKCVSGKTDGVSSEDFQKACVEMLTASSSDVDIH